MQFEIECAGPLTGPNEGLYSIWSSNGKATEDILPADSILEDENKSRFRVCRYRIEYVTWVRLKFLDGRAPVGKILDGK